MTLTDAAERLLPARHLSRVRPMLTRLSDVASGVDELATLDKLLMNRTPR